MSVNVLADVDPQRLAEEIEQLEYQNDVLASRLAAYETANQETFPAELVFRLSEGENPTLVWREHRGLAAGELASRVGLTEQALAMLETGTSEPGLRVMARIARALDVDVDDLVPWQQEEDATDN